MRNDKMMTILDVQVCFRCADVQMRKDKNMASLDMWIIQIFMRGKKMMDCKTEQMAICEKYGSPYYESLPISKIGVAKNLKDGIWPINGLRHPHEGDTTGWYIWAGENFSSDPDFFEPVHVIHIIESFPIIAQYLGLAPGMRFLITDTYEDVWEDPALLLI